jgi:exopolyphosphatase/guanosine-5'-triphosphate,3'-diphosphate pyrophosphatase
MPTFAAVDIGSNSVRLKIARLERRRLVTLHEDREVTRLGAEVFRTGVLDPAAIARTARVLQRFHRAAQSHGVTEVRVVATSALRDARNSHSFMEWVRSATGWNVEIISGLEEGRLIHLGVLSGSRLAARNLLLIDLGGGSCELTLSVAGHLRDMVSLPVGAVRLTEEFLAHDPPKKKELAAMRKFIAQELRRVEKRFTRERVPVTVATSGTAAALWDLWRTRRPDPRPTGVPRDGVVKLTSELSRLNLAERRALAGIGPRRAEIIIAGSTVFAELMNHLGLGSFRYSPLGLRDGLLAQMLAGYDRSARVRRQIEAERRDALLEMSRHYGVDRARAQRIRDLAEQLFRELRSVHQLPAEYGEWLSAAALLHEVGSFINRNGRHRHAFYIIAHSEIFGYTVRERRVIAAISRFVGKSLPTLTDRAIRMLPSADRLLVPRAVALLRLARALDQGRSGAVQGVTARVQRGTVRLRLKTRRQGADLELWAVGKERSYFRALFACDLTAEPVS